MSIKKTFSFGNSAGDRTAEGGIWLIGFLFTLGFAKLTFWQGVLALFIWPYFLGAKLGG